MVPSSRSAPAAEPVTLAEMKLRLGVDGPDEDDLISALIMAGRIVVERMTRVSMTAPVSEPLVQAVRLLVVFWFENRGGPRRLDRPSLPREALELIAPFVRLGVVARAIGGVSWAR